MKRLGLLLSIVFLVVLLGCSEEVAKQEHQIPVAHFKGVLLKDEQGREVTLKKDMPVYWAESNDSGVYIKIYINPMPNEVHVMDEITNEEIRGSTWKDGYPVIPYPKGSGLHKYKMIAIWNEPNEFHVHEAIVKFEIENQ